MIMFPNQHLGYRKSWFPLWFWFSTIPFLPSLWTISCFWFGSLAAVLLVSAARHKSVRIPFDALKLEGSSNSQGKHSLVSPFWEKGLSFSREEFLLLTGVPDGAQQAHRFSWLWTAIKPTVMCLLMSFLDKSSFRQADFFSYCLLSRSFYLHIKAFFFQTIQNNQVSELLVSLKYLS